jgi:ferredoxin
MRVWIDQDLCTGDGLCAELCPKVFVMQPDGLAYVREGDKVLAGSTGIALVPEEEMDAVIESAAECPGECIFITE